MGAFYDLLRGGYTTSKSVKVYSLRAVLAYYSLCALIFGYVILYMMLWNRGYQTYDSMIGTVHTKIKGSATAVQSLDPALAAKVWDAEDLVKYNSDSFFVPTKFSVTKQTQGTCSTGARSQSKTLKGVWTEKCTKDGHECQEGMQTFHGVQTGSCISDGQSLGPDMGLIGLCKGGALNDASCFGDDDQATCAEGGGKCKGSFCELRAWCPTEGSIPDATDTVHLDGWGNFSVFARIDAVFPKFGKQHNNLQQANGEQGLCPISQMDKGKCVAANLLFLRDVLERANVSFGDAADTGAEILLQVRWTDMQPMLGAKGRSPCNLDAANWKEACAPSYDFRRLDDPNNNSFSHGYNFRTVSAGSGSERHVTKWTGELENMGTGTKISNCRT